ncbi:MAG: type IV pili methyl-accepting chemotaxis transducer N-terminal domain-containing protein [Caldilineaceae bacterium]|nr:type IV pili methyl-accepting chemotaxis transducer N-terminal domain-containing protein [Caldilineaceae bacterium]
MVNSLRVRLGLLFLAFLLLVLAAVTVTYGVVASQRSDALRINLAGRQRMLSERMTWLALAGPTDPALATERQHFSLTLDALQHGGMAHTPDDTPVLLPPPDDVAVQTALASARQAWLRFDAELDRATGGERHSTLPDASAALITALDDVVAQLATQADAKVQRLQAIQASFLLLALLLLGVGYQVTRRHVLEPLTLLAASAQQMATGDLEKRVPTFPDEELRRLAVVLDALRAEVLASRRELEARVHQRTEELATAFEFSQEIAAQLELPRLLDSVTDRARTLMAGSAAALCLLDDEATALCLAAGSGAGDANPELRQPVSAALPSQVIGAGRTVVTETACTNCGFLRSVADGQCVATPLRAGAATLGALCVVRPASIVFEPEEQDALSLLANAAAVAIVNARLVEAGRAQSEVNAIQTERDRLAADLHDNLAQTLSFLNLKADQLEEAISAGATTDADRELGEMRAATTRAYNQVRAALTGLHAMPGAHSALAADLRACVAEMQATSGMAIELTIADAQALTLTPLAHQQTLHIVREALTNAWRHAAAQHVTVHAAGAQDLVRITVCDDGRGFDPAAVDESAHLGLAIMRARAERSGGVLAVRARPGAGAEIAATFPRYKERQNEPMAAVAGR